MHNNIINALQSHRSIRKYRSMPVSNKLLNKILNARIRASSSGNMQAYSIIVTQDKKMKQKLLPLHFNQNMLMDAPVFLTFCSDFNRMKIWLKQNNAPDNFDNLMSFLIGTIDATLASQNIAIAAESEGLGICFMGTTLASCNKISKILKLPKNVVPVVGFSLGYPDEDPKKRDRLSLESIVHSETYKKYSDKDINQIYSKKEKLGMERYLLNPKLKDEVERLKYNKSCSVIY